MGFRTLGYVSLSSALRGFKGFKIYVRNVASEDLASSPSVCLPTCLQPTYLHVCMRMHACMHAWMDGWIDGCRRMDA